VGPVPHVIETFTLDETADGTRLSSVELGTDLWRLGRPGVTWLPAAGWTRSATLWPRSRPRVNAAQRVSRAPAFDAVRRWRSQRTAPRDLAVRLAPIPL